MANSKIQVTRKIWISGGYVIIRPWPESNDCFEFCTEPGDESEKFFGKLSISFGDPEDMRALAEALNDAADEMQ